MLLAFAQRLSPHDLLFLRRDVSQPRVVVARIEAERLGKITPLLAVRDSAALGCTTIRDELSWSNRVGEMRVIIDPSARGKGLGQKLTPECLAIALEMGIEKMTEQMTVDQRGAIEGMGFRAEGLLANEVRDRAGTKHDVVMLSEDVATSYAQMAAYGLTAALSGLAGSTPS